jgi:nitrate reductase gamma subunit
LPALSICVHPRYPRYDPLHSTQGDERKSPWQSTQSAAEYGAIMILVNRHFQLGVIVLLLLAIFGVLLTPDPSDDPAGVMARLEKGRLLVTSLFVAHAVSLPPLGATSPVMFSRTQVPIQIAKFDLICIRLC